MESRHIHDISRILFAKAIHHLSMQPTP